MKTIFHIVGNRPQFIKLAILHNQLAKDDRFKQKIIHTGQHFSYEMSELFFKDLQIPDPAVNLSISNNSSALFIGAATEALTEYLKKQDDAAVLVYGDTNTTFAAATAAKNANTPLLHFEAGVRTNDDRMPEEMNRVLTDRLADVNYCCTENNFKTMQQERFSSVFVLTGDLMLDAFLQIKPAGNLQTNHTNYVVCTIHRQANLSESMRLKQIVNALNELHQSLPVVMPVHPHTKLKMEAYGLLPQFTTLPPLGYREMKSLLEGSDYIITDSGGTSREAFFLRKKSLIIMDYPFWPEIIAAGCSLNCPAEQPSIIETFHQLPSLQANFAGNIFGNGQAAVNISQHLKEYFQ